MTRMTTKIELLNEEKTKYSTLMALIDSIPLHHRNDIFVFDLEKEKGAHWARDKNIKDVIVHLYEWQQLLLNWVDSNRKGIANPFLKEGYNWKTYGEMNIEFCQNHQKTTLAQALALFSESREKTVLLLENFSDEELFSKGKFDWVGGSTLGSYFISTTSSHYDWAIKKIKKFKKSIT